MKKMPLCVEKPSQHLVKDIKFYFNLHDFLNIATT